MYVSTTCCAQVFCSFPMFSASLAEHCCDYRERGSGQARVQCPVGSSSCRTAGTALIERASTSRQCEW